MRIISTFLLALFLWSAPRAGVLADSLLKKIEVREIQLQFDFSDADCSTLLFNQFGFTPYTLQFFDLSTEFWFPQWIKFRRQILLLAAEKGYDTASLDRCFDKIAPKPNDEMALIPIGAYLTNQKNQDVWILLCVWEYVDKLNGTYVTMGHVRGWAFSAKNQRLLCYMSCM
jgi:hypothetical protein